LAKTRAGLLSSHTNELKGAVSTSWPFMADGSAQRAMPGSTYCRLINVESQCSSQSQYNGLPPSAMCVIAWKLRNYLML